MSPALFTLVYLDAVHRRAREDRTPADRPAPRPAARPREVRR